MEDVQKTGLTDRALKRAQLESVKAEDRIELRIPSYVKNAATTACERHGVSLSAFLRACCAELAEEYGA